MAASSSSRTIIRGSRRSSRCRALPPRQQRREAYRGLRRPAPGRKAWRRVGERDARGGGAELSAVVSLIYQAAIEFERWPAALLRTSDLFGGTMAGLVKGDRATGSVSTLAVRSYPGAREEYATHYHARNIA